MSWIRLDDAMTFNAKVVRLGNAAVGARDRMMCWSSQQGLGGHIPLDVAMLIAGDEALLRRMFVGQMLDRSDEAKLEANSKQTGTNREAEPFPASFYVHDFHEQNPTADENASRKSKQNEARRKAGIVGGKASGAARRAKQVEANSKQNEANDERTVERFANENEPPSRPVPSRPVPSRESETRAASPLTLPPESPSTEPIAEILAELAIGRDLYPVAEIPDAKLRAVAERIARIFAGDLSRGVPPVDDLTAATRDAVAYGRSHRASRRAATGEQVLAEIERKAGFVAKDLAVDARREREQRRAAVAASKPEPTQEARAATQARLQAEAEAEERAGSERAWQELQERRAREAKS